MYFMPDLPTRGPEVLGPLFDQVVEESGAHGGLLLLLPPGEPMLFAALLSGFPAKYVGPWTRIWLQSNFAIARSARERRQIWMGPSERALLYPESAVAAPYPYAVVDTPLVTGDTLWGVLNLLWPGSHPPEPVPEELKVVDAGAHRLSKLLNRCAEDGHPVRPHRRPLVVHRQEANHYRADEARAGAHFAERLPGGGLGMNLEGEVTFVTAAAADLLGTARGDLIGALPWEALPWLSDLVYEDSYRRALFTRLPTSFTALRPPDVWLSFRLFPGASGISVRLKRTAAPAGTATSGIPARTTEAAALTPTTDEAPTRVGSLYHLMQLATVLSQAVEVQDVVKIVCSPVMSAFDAEGIALLTVDGARLRLLGHRGLPEEATRMIDGRLVDIATPAARCILEQEALYFSSPQEMDHAFSGWSARSRLSAFAMMPLTALGRPVGCVAFGYREPHRFGSGYRTLFTSLSGLLAQALDRAQLYDTQHQLARRLQDLLLPTALPEIPGLQVAARYRPATRGVEIGGDFYDLIRLDSGCAAAIGDVQGHNVTAAALMGQVRTAVHATAGARPDEVLTRANKLLTDLDAGLFTSCLYAHVDFATHRAVLATAGHPPPLLLDPEGQVTILDVPPGPLLGIEPDALYTPMETPLPPGSALLLYTDGLVETPGTDIDVSLAELADHLRRTAGSPPDAIADGLLRQAPGSTAGTDDVALILIRREDDQG